MILAEGDLYEIEAGDVIRDQKKARRTVPYRSAACASAGYVVFHLRIYGNDHRLFFL